MRAYTILFFILFFNFTVLAGEKACPVCNFDLIEKAVNIKGCEKYSKYFFPDQKISKAYENFAAYFVPQHTYAEFWKKYLPDSNEKYTVDKKYVDNHYIQLSYEIIPKKIHLKEKKKANIEMQIDNSSYYFQLREVDGGTEISECFSTK